MAIGHSSGCERHVVQVLSTTNRGVTDIYVHTIRICVHIFGFARRQRAYANAEDVGCANEVRHNLTRCAPCDIHRRIFSGIVAAQRSCRTPDRSDGVRRGAVWLHWDDRRSAGWNVVVHIDGGRFGVVHEASSICPMARRIHRRRHND